MIVSPSSCRRLRPSLDPPTVRDVSLGLEDGGCTRRQHAAASGSGTRSRGAPRSRLSGPVHASHPSDTGPRRLLERSGVVLGRLVVHEDAMRSTMAVSEARGRIFGELAGRVHVRMKGLGIHIVRIGPLVLLHGPRAFRSVPHHVGKRGWPHEAQHGGYEGQTRQEPEEDGGPHRDKEDVEDGRLRAWQAAGARERRAGVRDEDRTRHNGPRPAPARKSVPSSVERPALSTEKPMYSRACRVLSRRVRPGAITYA